MIGGGAGVPSGPAGLPRSVHAACVGVVVFADGIVMAHDLVGLDCADAQCPDESVFNGLGQGWGAQRACGLDGLGYGYVGRFDAVPLCMQNESNHWRLKPLTFVTLNLWSASIAMCSPDLWCLTVM